MDLSSKEVQELTTPKIMEADAIPEYEAYTLRDKNPKARPKWKYSEITHLDFRSQDEIKETIRELNNETTQCAAKFDNLLPSQRAVITTWLGKRAADDTETQFDIDQLKIYQRKANGRQPKGLETTSITIFLRRTVRKQDSAEAQTPPQEISIGGTKTDMLTTDEPPNLAGSRPRKKRTKRKKRAALTVEPDHFQLRVNETNSDIIGSTDLQHAETLARQDSLIDGLLGVSDETQSVANPLIENEKAEREIDNDPPPAYSSPLQRIDSHQDEPISEINDEVPALDLGSSSSEESLETKYDLNDTARLHTDTEKPLHALYALPFLWRTKQKVKSSGPDDEREDPEWEDEELERIIQLEKGIGREFGIPTPRRGSGGYIQRVFMYPSTRPARPIQGVVLLDSGGGCNLIQKVTAEELRARISPPSFYEPHFLDGIGGRNEILGTTKVVFLGAGDQAQPWNEKFIVVQDIPGGFDLLLGRAWMEKHLPDSIPRALPFKIKPMTDKGKLEQLVRKQKQELEAGKQDKEREAQLQKEEAERHAKFALGEKD